MAAHPPPPPGPVQQGMLQGTAGPAPEGRKRGFTIDTLAIPAVPLGRDFSGDTLQHLQELGVKAYEPSVVEENVMHQMDRQLKVEAAAQAEKQRRRISAERAAVREQLAEAMDAQKALAGKPDSQQARDQASDLRILMDFKRRRLEELDKEERMLNAMEHRSQKQQSARAAAAGGESKEMARERLLRTGKITPFELLASRRASASSAAPDAATAASSGRPAAAAAPEPEPRAPQPMAQQPPASLVQTQPLASPHTTPPPPPAPRLPARPPAPGDARAEAVEPSARAASPQQTLRQPPLAALRQGTAAPVPPTSVPGRSTSKAPKRRRGRSKRVQDDASYHDDSSSADTANDDLEVGADEGDDGEASLERDPAGRRKVPGPPRKRLHRLSSSPQAPPSDVEDEADGAGNGEAEAPLPDYNGSADITLEGGLRLPQALFDRLFDYQQTGLKWLWELHQQQVGGIVGDEMGLGKTIQTAAFLGALHHSAQLPGPSLVVCPATVLRQWGRELRAWWPRFDIALLHASCSPAELASTLTRFGDPAFLTADKVFVTTYECLRLNQEAFLAVPWGYVVLDEGHRIRNPDADITLVCKRLATTHRLLLTGAPIQNNLKELWSLFDFIYPGKLGTLPVFLTEFSVPIALGGYANASPTQVHTAYKCALVLRSIIGPFLLRRLKADVDVALPAKTEQVLFCRLDEEQAKAYKAYLASKELEAVFDGERNPLKAIDALRKVCNHPDLLERPTARLDPEYGDPSRSGKLRVLKQLLPMWRAQGHRVLLFSQTRQMLDILERFVVGLELSFRRLDGATPIKARLRMIDEYNGDPDIFLMLLTTRVGGLGVNLTGADRVVIFDPDWNPTVDTQARERAWRIGQRRAVAVYRLMTRGTIEEKIYHRQIYKQFLTNKVLRDPRQRRLFKANDLRDLFSYDDSEHARPTETEELFSNELEEAAEAAHPAGSQLKAEGESDAEQLSDDADGPLDAAGRARRQAIRNALVAPAGQVAAPALPGVRVMAHEPIAGTPAPELELLEMEAARVAVAAAAQLQADVQRCSEGSVSEPTWTGRSGSAGAPRRFGRSMLSTALPPERASDGAGGSQAVLQSIARRQNVQVGGPEAGGGEERRRGDMIAALRRFLLTMGGSAPSDLIVERFQSGVASADLPLFRQMLKQIAGFDKATRAWSLLPAYR